MTQHDQRLTRDDITELYRSLLGRAPEAENVYTEYAAAFSTPAEAKTFIVSSDEYLRRQAAMRRSFEHRGIRKTHELAAERWIGAGSAFWLEWDHPLEAPRHFSDIVASLENDRWHQLIKPGSTAIDIGTHTGDTTIPMGLFTFDRQNYRKGNVIGIEPNPELHPIVSECFALNSHVANFYLERCAITNADVDEIEISDHGNANCNGGIIYDFAGGLTDQLRTSATVTYKTPGKTLETIISEYSKVLDPSDIQFIKTDCEGYDKEIIRSSSRILAQLKPILFVEWFAWFSPDDSQDLFQTIAEAGYIPLNPKTMAPAAFDGERISDLTCIHRDRIGELL